jgi:hypothetical protein
MISVPLRTAVDVVEDGRVCELQASFPERLEGISRVEALLRGFGVGLRHVGRVFLKDLLLVEVDLDRGGQGVEVLVSYLD